MENFSKTHHQIVKEIGCILSHLGANSGIMANVMSWGDTMNSKETLQCLKDYREKYIEKSELFNKRQTLLLIRGFNYL